MQLKFALLVSLFPLFSLGAPITNDQAVEPRMLKTGASTLQRVGKLVGQVAKQNGGAQNYNDLAWQKTAEKYNAAKPDAKKAEAAAKAGILHGEAVHGWDKNADYSLRSGIHGQDPKRPGQAGYFKDPNQKWVTVQGSTAGGTVAHHIPVDAHGNHDPTVPIYTAPGPNKNSGKTGVPGKGTKFGKRESMIAFEA